MKLILNKQFTVYSKELNCPYKGCPYSFKTQAALEAHIVLMHS